MQLQWSRQGVALRFWSPNNRILNRRNERKLPSDPWAQMAAVAAVAASEPAARLHADLAIRVQLCERAAKLWENVPRTNLPKFTEQLIVLQDVLGSLEPNQIEVSWSPQMVELHRVSFLATRHVTFLAHPSERPFRVFRPGDAEQGVEQDGDVRFRPQAEGQAPRPT